MTKYNQLPKPTWRRGDGISVSVNVLCIAVASKEGEGWPGEVHGIPNKVRGTPGKETFLFSARVLCPSHCTPWANLRKGSFFRSRDTMQATITAMCYQYSVCSKKSDAVPLRLRGNLVSKQRPWNQRIDRKIHERISILRKIFRYLTAM